MKKIVLLLFFLFSVYLINNVKANSSDYFSENLEEIEKQFSDLNEMETFIVANNIESISHLKASGYFSDMLFSEKYIVLPQNPQSVQAPGRIPSFLFTFVISAIGTYTLYGAGAGFIAAGIVYLSTSGDRKEVINASLGCLTGLIVGGGIKYLTVHR